MQFDQKRNLIERCKCHIEESSSIEVVAQVVANKIIKPDSLAERQKVEDKIFKIGKFCSLHRGFLYLIQDIQAPKISLVSLSTFNIKKAKSEQIAKMNLIEQVVRHDNLSEPSGAAVIAKKPNSKKIFNSIKRKNKTKDQSIPK